LVLPASTGRERAQACRGAVGADPPTLSCSVPFAHQGTPLHTVIARSRELLAEAKEVPNKNAVAVGYITGSGSRAHTVRPWRSDWRSEEHTSELQSRFDLVCRLLLEKKNNKSR